MFFEVPEKTLPEKSIYQLVTAPGQLIRRSLFGNKSHVMCDWAGILTRHLARGWRLVDVFCEVTTPPSSSLLASAQSKIQTVWFFEKPESRARDDTPVYEGSVVEQWVEFLPSCGRSSSCLNSGGASRRRNTECGRKPRSKKSLTLRRKDDGTQQRRRKSSSDKRSSADVTAVDAKSSIPKEDRNSSEAEEGNNAAESFCARRDDAVAGWETMVRSMGEKGWELVCVINTMDTQVVTKRTMVKVLLVFQRRLSLLFSVPGRRTSDGMSLR